MMAIKHLFRSIALITFIVIGTAKGFCPIPSVAFTCDLAHKQLFADKFLPTKTFLHPDQGPELEACAYDLMKKAVAKTRAKKMKTKGKSTTSILGRCIPFFSQRKDKK
mmetsp:Transcript_32073/g.49042  ORF Transcript_32073/g.49042 Transcript_32073/m.49042 type:complete len:108 (-) Transcript_32073:242-565(-)|eukprot:CAMPEP_0118702082 /NCGR_PEP_ID=MMETSP0800-20121206/17656_1 /TAXON_ID=210618 ORGANISM="Striatella unipunctata, Strain CCMP2910" /NCGR_SAMPLE_ID=MMETSP0800 /ASSEMBLY_ACC=CAM_ASM_000638 /LENGTH=107 /DNA_ID=CAMNT_0006603169 /DNA_START=72 /DNA_END=395 /DNA_ORIENTATION=-